MKLHYECLDVEEFSAGIRSYREVWIDDGSFGLKNDRKNSRKYVISNLIKKEE